MADAISLARAAGPNGAWAQLAARLAAVPEYVELFRAAFPNEVETKADLPFTHAAGAIAAFQASAFRADESPFDRYLRGDRSALSNSAKHGMGLFYGKAACMDCHSGEFQTDQKFHTIPTIDRRGALASYDRDRCTHSAASGESVCPRSPGLDLGGTVCSQEYRRYHCHPCRGGGQISTVVDRVLTPQLSPNFIAG